MAADTRAEASLLKHYRLQDPFPEKWSDPIEDAQIAQRERSRASTSRYSILQEEGVSASLKGLVGGDLYSSGAVAEDEPDPLGTTDSVVRVLNKRGLPVMENVRLRLFAPLLLILLRGTCRGALVDGSLTAVVGAGWREQEIATLYHPRRSRRQRSYAMSTPRRHRRGCSRGSTT